MRKILGENLGKKFKAAGAVICAAASLFGVLTLSACGAPSGESADAPQGEIETPSGEIADAPDAVAENQAASVVYEAVFLNNDDVLSCFRQVRGEDAPYEKIPADFHVTTAFRPESDMRDFYGTEVTVRVTGYKAGEVTDDNGDATYNEGFSVSMETENAEFAAYLAGLENNWHITGSYSGAAKYTGYLDFSDARDVSFELAGVFGAYLENGDIIFDGAAVGADKNAARRFNQEG